MAKAVAQGVSYPDLLDLIRARMEARRGEWKAIAKKAGVTWRWVISFMERDYDNVRLEHVIKLAAALGMTIEFVLAPAPSGSRKK